MGKVRITTGRPSEIADLDRQIGATRSEIRMAQEMLGACLGRLDDNADAIDSALDHMDTIAADHARAQITHLVGEGSRTGNMIHETLGRIDRLNTKVDELLERRHALTTD